MKKYLIRPGYIYSTNDKDKHFISAIMLINLYRVNPRECVIEHPAMHYQPEPDLIILEPQADGSYSIPDSTPNYLAKH